MAQNLSDFDIYAKYDVPKIYLGIALLVFLIIGGVTGYIVYKNPTASANTDELTQRLAGDKERLQNTLDGIDTEIQNATVHTDLTNLADEVEKLVTINTACQADLQTCNSDLQKYENPEITCGKGTEKKEGYCHKIGLEDTDFETRGIGVLMGMLGLGAIVYTKL